MIALAAAALVATAAWSDVSRDAGRMEPVARTRSAMQVRVRLRKALREVEVSGIALRISSPSGFIAIASGPLGLRKAKIVRQRKGMWLVRWDSQPSQRIEAERLWVRGEMLRLGLEPVPYDLEVYDNAKTGADVVAHLDLDSYLMGVLPSEMPASWPLEALKAQAIAARSFVISRANERREQAFDVESSIIDQVYTFLHEAELHPDWLRKIQRAVKETRGEVLVDADQRVLRAFYSADCGCNSEDPKFVWGEMPAFQSVADSSCKRRRTATWDFKLARKEVRQKLLTSFAIAEPAQLRALHVAGRTPSGRVAHLIAAIETEGQTKSLQLSAQEFRRIFGFNRIRSADFTLRWLGEELAIEGQGLGHGVGMCQTGARTLAQEGMNYRDILKRYYPKAQLRTAKRT